MLTPSFKCVPVIKFQRMFVSYVRKNCFKSMFGYLYFSPNMFLINDKNYVANNYGSVYIINHLISVCLVV